MKGSIDGGKVMERREVDIRNEREIGDEGIFVREVIKIIRVY
jgi:hypothetical protein